MDFEGKHAVIIEDNLINAEVLMNLLAKVGITATLLDSNVDILKHLSELPSVNIIFLDLEMPGKSGYEVVRSLKTEDWTTRVPVVAYTTHISHVHEARQAGFHSFLGKPLRRDKFFEQLEQIMSGESVWDLT